MAKKPSMLRRLLTFVWSALDTSRRVILNLVFLLIVVGVIAAMVGDDPGEAIPEQAALVLNIKGDIVEQKVQVNPFDAVMQESMGQGEQTPEVLLSDILFVLEQAKDDVRITSLVLDLKGLSRGGLNKLDAVGAAINDFKTSGKPVIAIGDYFTQNQYYLASFADKVILNPNGMVAIEGYGRYQMYMKSALEKLKISTHVFRVGTYKSAVEPFIRDDMSDAAKEANKAWLGALWEQYTAGVSERRTLVENAFKGDFASTLELLNQAEGNFATYALNLGLVDELKEKEQIRQDLIAISGENEHNNFNQVGFDRYLKEVKLPFDIPTAKDRVGLVVAKGTILDGNQPAGTVGGESTARLLRQARFDDTIKAVVLRVDSPGGSAFASELIRQEVLALKAAGKPVVASMSTYAASGGYWISASANEIWASPSTITGSIGIFGMFATLENSLSTLGLHTDGVGTTEMTGLSATRALPQGMSDIIQRNIEAGYDRFITLVAETRNLDKAEVDKIAQGRVWIGKTAKEIGLVDHLGNYQDAIDAAAKLAGLERFDTKVVEKELSPKEQLVKDILDNAQVLLPEQQSFTPTPAQNIIKQLMQQAELLNKFNDPNGTYAYCMACEL